MSKKGTGKFWIGKGTLGDIKQHEEIPIDFLTPERMKKFESEGLIGDKFKPSDSSEKNFLKEKITDLENQLKLSVDELEFSKEQVKDLEAQLKKAKSK